MKRKILVSILIFICCVALAGCEDLFSGGDQDPGYESDNGVATVGFVKKSVVKIETDIGTGSGFAAIRDSWIITNYHVIEGAGKIYVIDNNENKTEIESIVLLDKENDIAVLKSGRSFDMLELGDGNSIDLLDKVTAIGSPEGVLNTVSVGEISNVNFEDYIVISAPISPGSSGGVLLNEANEVIGITTATANNELAQNLNFAINVETLKSVVSEYDQGNFMTRVYPPDTKVGIIVPTKSDKPMNSFLYAWAEYLREEAAYRFKLTFADDKGVRIAADFSYSLSIKNDAEEEVYNGSGECSYRDFTYEKTMNGFEAFIYITIPISDITEGESAVGSFMFTVGSDEGRSFEQVGNIETGLPIAEPPFEKIVFSGSGSTVTEPVNIPYGSYYITTQYNGKGNFSVTLNGRVIADSRRHGDQNGVCSVYQINPQELSDSQFGTPLTDSSITVEADENEKWEITIERAEDTKDKEYTDGSSFSGKGSGFIKNIFMPKDDYFITFTHSGGGSFRATLPDGSSVNETGKTDCVVKLRADSLSDLDNRYINIVADGGWTVKIERAVPSDRYSGDKTYTGIGNSSINNINLPKGNYNIIVIYSGDDHFTLELNDRSVVRENGPLRFLYRIWEEPTSFQNVSTPISAGYINIYCSGEWTVIIEEADID